MISPEAIRKKLRARRARLSPRERLEAADGLAEQLEALPETLADEFIAGYWAVRGELALHRVTSGIVRRGQQYHLPVCHGDALRFAPWAPGRPIAPNRYGIPEPKVAADEWLAPEDMQLVLVPLLAFDRQGNRLGSGAGYYDRSFAFLRKGERPREPVLIGVAYSFQEVERIAPQEWDVTLDFIATEHELIECRPAHRKRA
jgi:5-formyltetrahydrofolate cyclo-ligase